MQNIQEYILEMYDLSFWFLVLVNLLVVIYTSFKYEGGNFYTGNESMYNAFRYFSIAIYIVSIILMITFINNPIVRLILIASSTVFVMEYAMTNG